MTATQKAAEVLATHNVGAACSCDGCQLARLVLTEAAPKDLVPLWTGNTVVMVERAAVERNPPAT